MELRPLTNDVLLARLQALAGQEREHLGDILEHIAEVDRRELALDRGYPSLFHYCVKALRYSEAAAFLRIRAARATIKFPRILDDLRGGKLHLDAVARLYPYLTRENSEVLLGRASGASKREVLSLIAGFETVRPERDVVRFLPPPSRSDVSPTPVASMPAMVDPTKEDTADAGLITPAQEATMGRGSAIPAQTVPVGTGSSAPTASADAILPPPARVRFSFTADDELVILLDRLRGLLRHKHPEGRLEDLFKDSARALLERIDPALRAPSSPRNPSTPGSRRVPAAVKAEVWKRDEGRCSYISEEGRHCQSRDALEYDHILPWALGGRSDLVKNIRLLCRPHNLRLARRRFGPRRRSQPAARALLCSDTLNAR